MKTVNVIEAIFFAALDKKDANERADYLDKACVGDADLRRCVEKLLSAQPKVGEFMQAPAAGLPETKDSPSDERPGTVLGPYKLLHDIGEGGMGTVWMAEQSEPVRRRVALKVIKPGMDSRQVLARFEAERQALALMDHPNIAKVLDAGATATGRPYFVMELVKGQPITEFCDKNKLTPRERLALFVPVCHAIQHAHQKGVIHRDIKPSNVLVALYDGKPVPKVIDFGVAKATAEPLTDKTLFTRHGQVVGTFEYMSPEQATLDQVDVDTRSDVYSLGVLLYELMTGTTPLEKERLRKAGLAEVLRLIREEEPPKPSTRLTSSPGLLAMAAAQRKTESQKLPRVVRGELDWIVMKALDKDRERRFPTPNGLARDIERYLKGEEVTACPPTRAYRFQKWARKHKVAFTVTSAVAAALVVGIALTGWQAVRATNAERATATAMDTVEGERDKALKAEKIAADERDKTNAAFAENQRTQAIMRRHEYAWDIQALASVWTSGGVKEAQQLLERHRPNPGEVRGFEYGYWDNVTHAERRSDQLIMRVGQFSYDREYAFSADGTRVVCLQRETRGPRSEENDTTKAIHVSVWDTASRKEIWSHQIQSADSSSANFGAQRNLQLSRDGKRLLVHDTIGERSTPVAPQSPFEGGFRLSRRRHIVLDVDARKEIFDSDIVDKTIRYAAVAQLSPDGSKLLTPLVGVDGDTPRPAETKVWFLDAPDKEPVTMPRLSGVTFSPDGARIVGVIGGMSKVYDADTGKELVTLGGASLCRFNGDGTLLAGVVIEGEGANETATLKVWDPASGKEQKAIRLPAFPRTVRAPAFKGTFQGQIPFSLLVSVPIFNSDSSRVAIPHRLPATPAAPTRLQWAMVNLKTDKIDYLLDDPRSNPAPRVGGMGGFRGNLVDNLMFSPDGSLFIIPDDNTIAIHDTASGRQLHVLRGHVNAVAAFMPDPDGARLWSVESSNGVLKEWDIRPKEPRRITLPPDSGRAVGPTRRMVVSGDAEWVATFSAETEAWFVDVVNTAGHGSTRLTARRRGQDARQSTPTGGGLAISRDGKRVALVRPARQRPGKGPNGKFEPANPMEESANADVTVWDVATGKEIFYQELPEKGAARGSLYWGVALSPDGKQVAVGYQQIRPFTGNVLPDDEKQDVLVKVFDIDSRSLRTSIPTGGAGVSGLSFSPDGRLIAGAITSKRSEKRPNDKLTVWDVAEGKPLFEVDVWVSSHPSLNWPAWSQDGTRLAFVETFPSPGIRIYNAATGKLEATMNTTDRGGTFAVIRDNSLVFSPDGRRIACLMDTRQAADVVKLWDTESEKELLSLETPRGTVRNATLAAIAFTPDGHKLRKMQLNPGERPFNPAANEPTPGAITVTTWDATPRAEGPTK